MEPNEEELIIRYLKGDEKALEALIQRYLKPIFGFIFQYLGNQNDTQDLVQEVFLKVWQNLKKFDRHKNFKAWTFKIAKNTVIDFLRKKKTIPFSAFENEDGENQIIDNLSDPAPLPDELFDRQDLADFLDKTLNQLPPKYREVLYLYYQDHFNFREIAELLEEPVDTIKSRHRRGLIVLRKLLDKND